MPAIHAHPAKWDAVEQASKRTCNAQTRQRQAGIVGGVALRGTRSKKGSILEEVVRVVLIADSNALFRQPRHLGHVVGGRTA